MTFSADQGLDDAPASPGWRDWSVLAGLLVLAAGLRFYEITKVGLWPDEFWSSVHLATGRGTAIFELPVGVLIDPPPATLLEGAPAWWHVWTGLRGIVHPPLYLILLRWWMDLFGTGDFATRAFSVAASLGGIVVLFDIVRRTISNRAGLIAAALMAVSPLQIDLSQETRPYSLLALMGLLACHALIRVEQDGPSSWRLLQLGLASAGLALTHYFSFGALLAIVGYVILRFRGANRRKTLAAIGMALALVAICWGPFLWQQHREFFRQQDWSLDPAGSPRLTLIRLAAVPAALLYGRAESELSWLAPCGIGLLLPLFLIRRRPQLLLWWLWILGILGSLAVYDWINHARLLGIIKYSSLASVGMYALCATPLPNRKWWRWLIPCLVVVGVAVAAAQRLQMGPSEENGDWRGMSEGVDRLAGPRDPLVFYPDRFWGPPGMYYLAVAHYGRNTQRPIMLLDGPADAAALGQLAKFPRVWLIGPAAVKDAPTYLPGWGIVLHRWFPNSGGFAELAPISPAQSRPARP